MLPSIRPNVLRMTAYSPGKPISEVQRELGLERVIKLASNENPLGPSPLAVEAVQEAALQMHLYPDASGYELKQAISTRFGISDNAILLGNGSDELIHLLGLIFLDSPEDEMIVGDPSFVRYDAAAFLAGSKLIKVPLDTDYRHNLPAMASAAGPNTKMIFVANPNNPTGTIVRRDEFERFLAAVPEHVMIVLDEAYFEFASEVADYPTSLEYLAQDPRIIGLRTFSKTYGLAGIRIGYGFAAPEVVDAIDRAREPFNVNSLAQAAAIAALSDREHINRTVENNRAGIATITRALQDAGATAYESYANFVFTDLGRAALPVYEGLLRRGVIVRPIGRPTWLRISVGTPEENEIFSRELAAVMSQPS